MTHAQLLSELWPVSGFARLGGVMRRLRWAACAFVPAFGSAQQVEEVVVRPAVSAVRTDASIDVDGILDDVVWRDAPAVSGFTQRQPDEGAPASERTEVRIAYDDHAVYVAARLYDASGSVSSRLGRRDSNLPGSDWFTVEFDTYHDHRTGFRFSVNPAGVRQDAQLSDNGGDEGWDPIWDAKARIDAEGWSVEMRIPLSQLRFRPAAQQTWGVQFIRELSRRNEESWFAFTPRSERSGIARYGHLEGLDGLGTTARLELLPYASTRVYNRTVPQDEDAGFANPFTDGSDVNASIGVDLKYRLASNLTLSATINPDFGQVEADPAVINLSAFETRFDERRPFFIEGANTFEFGSELFYSRRIGAAPAGRAPSEAVYSDQPEQATILGAAKVTGRLGNWTIGVLNALTAREHAEYVDANGEHADAVVAPLANYTVARARRELRDGQSVFGGMFTGTYRDLENTPLRDRLRTSAVAGGMDFSHEWADRSWRISGFVSAARIHGSTATIASAQRSSARYYQRPDADYLSIDPAATSMQGFSGELELSKQAGVHWRGNMQFSTVSPGYETNDLGFQSRADEHDLWINLRYLEEQPGRVFREWSIEANPSASWNYGGDRLGTDLGLEFDAELLNYWNFNVEASRDFAAWDDRLTRGGPLTRQPAGTRWEFRAESDDRKPWVLEFNADYSTGEAGNGAELGFEIGVRPAPNWSFSLEPEFSVEHSRAQYIDSFEDATAVRTFGRRYVFAELRQREIGLAANLDITFTPGLTLELYARPFLGSGRYGRPRELVAPRTFEFRDYDDAQIVDGEWAIDPDGSGPAARFSVEQEDFTFRSLHGSAVMRWEWRAGSTLFLVWQQEREEEDRIGNLRLRRDLRRLGNTRPENVFVVKLSYWLNM